MNQLHPTVGTVVQLNSGGPAMTIVKIEDVLCHCNWFMPDATLRAHTFPASALSRSRPGAVPGADATGEEG